MADIYDLIFGAETYNPCEAARLIRPHYYRLVAGQSTVEVEFRDRRLKMGAADMAALGGLLARMEKECAEKNGLPEPAQHRRRAMIGVPLSKDRNY